jgi:prepilin-type N-terminal cleavage/methylation domain-containing protein
MRTATPMKADPARLGPRRRAGFTLIELLLSIGIGAVVLSAVYQIYGGVTRSAQRIESAADRVQAWRFFAERLRRDLANLGAREFSGGEDALSFELVLNDGSRERVRYGLFDTVDGLEIRRSGGVATGVGVYQNVQALGFRYFDGKDWRQHSPEGGLPRAVECSVRQDGRQRTLILGLELQRVGQASDA